jgi:NAD(P)-dependent dehydrogenase (short-subunit alcohol dehydrogenase family)
MGMLDGKVVIVTGAGRGIGREEALACARAGAAVVVDDLAGAADTADLIRAEGGRALALDVDVADFQAAGHLVTAAIDGFGGLHGVVNSAGVTRDRMTVEMTPEDFDDVLRVNLRAAFCTTRHAARWWRRHGGPGAIINTTSVAGLRGNPGQGNDGAAKAAVAAWTVITALELARYQVRVNAIAPASGACAAGAPLAGRTLAPWARSPLGPLDPADVAPVAVWLLSDAAAGVSGQVFGISGGVVELYRGWTPVRSIEADGRWAPEALAAAAGCLFAGAPAVAAGERAPQGP